MGAPYLVKLEVTFFIKNLNFITKGLNDTAKEAKFANTGKQGILRRDLLASPLDPKYQFLKYALGHMS